MTTIYGKYRIRCGRLYAVLTNNDNDTTAEVQEDFAYDKFGDAVTVGQKVIDYNSILYLTNYTYDLLGRRTRADYPASSYGSVSVTYTYDMPGRLTQIGSNAGNPFANYTYDNKAQMVTEVLNPSGTPKHEHLAITQKDG